MKFVSKKYIHALYNGFGTVFASLLIAIFTANLLTVEERGALQLVIVNATMLSIFYSFSVPFHNAYKINNNDPRPADSNFYVCSMILQLATSFILYDSGFLTELYLYMTFCLAFFACYYVTERSKNTVEISIYSHIQIIQPVCCLLLIAIFFCFKEELSLRDVLISYTASYCVSFLYYITKSKTFVFSRHFLLSKLDWKFSLSYWIFQISSSVVTNIDKLFLGYFFGIKQLGIYAVLQTVSSFFSRIAERVAITYFVSAKNSDFEAIRKKITLTCFLLSPIMFGLGYIFGEFIIGHIFSESYSKNGITSAILFLSVLISSASWIISQRATASGKPLLLVAVNVISLIVFLISVLVLKFENDIINIAMSTLIASVSRYLFSYYKYK